MRYVVITNPDGLRWKAYGDELARFWEGRAEVVAVPWADVVPRLGDLDGLAAFDEPAVVRIESPGRDWDVARMLLRAGDGDDNWLSLPYRKGHLVAPNTFYRGFVRVLEGLKRSFEKRPHLRPTACPLDVGRMFDKNDTCRRLRAAGISTPETWECEPADYDEVEHIVRAHCRWPVAYVKLNSGSSASGIAVLHGLDEPPWATSSVVRIGGGFFSSRRLARHRGDDLRAVIDFLAREGVCVQRGVRMAQIDGANFDVRVVVIHGRPAFTIFRLSHAPMTNLHLGGTRGDVARCRAAIPPRVWLDGLDACVEAAALYDSASVGVDLLFEAGYLRHHVLEVNAFGDFFPNLTDEQGRSVHRVEIEETARRMGYGVQ